MPIDNDIFRDIGQQSARPSAAQDEIFADLPSTSATKFKPVKLGMEGFRQTVADEYKERNWADRQLIAAGLGMSNLIERGKQLIGRGDASSIEANRVIAKENPGMSIAGNVALLAPTMMIPGANTYAGASLIGGLTGAAQPTLEGESTLKNVALGTAGGAAGKYVGDKAGALFSQRAASVAASQGKNAPRDAVLSRSQELGLAVPKSEVNPGVFSDFLESMAGKAALRQQATLNNQNVINQLGGKVIGLADDQPISTTALNDFRNTVSQPYKEVAALNKRAEYALEKLKETRAESKNYWNHYNRSADPTSLKTAKALDQKAQSLESVIDNIASKSGKPGLLNDLREARKLIAQSHDLERATNLVTGEVSAPVLGRLLDKGKPLSGELSDIARFQQAFPKFAGVGSTTQAPGVSAINPLVSAGMGIGLGGVPGVIAGGLPLLRGPLRSSLLSPSYQNLLVKPNYSTGLLTAGQSIANQLPVTSAYGAVEAFR